MKGKKYILIHLGTWLIMILPTFFIMFGDFEQIHTDRLVIFLFNTLFTVFNFYLFFSLIIPQLYEKNKITLMIIISILFLIVYPLLQYEIFVLLNDIVDIKWRRIRYKDYFFSQAYSTTILYTGLAFLARFTIKWISDKQKQVELINQNQTSELALLRSQINPHFLFNTLNNIYSLVMKKSDNAPQAMMKLSEIMRYMLYETNTDKVLLEKENTYLQSYIELMQLRLKKKDFISFNVKGDTTCVEIAPMMLVPFVENAFKHCNKNVESPGITIEMEIEDKTMKYRVVNFLKSETTDDLEKTGGIGLNNIKRRLELLYPNKSRLNINKTEDKFEVVLQLELTS